MRVFSTVSRQDGSGHQNKRHHLLVNEENAFGEVKPGGTFSTMDKMNSGSTILQAKCLAASQILGERVDEALTTSEIMPTKA